MGTSKTRKEAKETPVTAKKAKQLLIIDCFLGGEGMAELLHNRELVLVRYLDHVLYHRSSALAMKPQVREAVGWLIYECDQYVTLAWDHDVEPPTLHGGDPKASGLVLLKTDILALKKLGTCSQPLQEISNCHLNCQTTIVKDEYALQTKKRKTPGAKGSKRNTGDKATCQ